MVAREDSHESELISSFLPSVPAVPVWTFLLTCLFISPAHGELPFVAQAEVHFSEVEGSIFVVIDDVAPEGSPDGQVDRSFTLQRKANARFPHELLSTLESAVVFYDRYRLAIRSPQLTQDLVLAVGSPDDLIENPFHQNLFRAVGKADARGEAPKVGGKPTLTIFGVGLIRHGSVVGLESARERQAALETTSSELADAVVAGAVFCPDGSGNGNVDCFYGGCGASQCNVDCNVGPGCDVTCASGYFACCGCGLFDHFGCKCYSNDECGC